MTESQAQCAFKNLKTHEVLQFALRIASSCALHRTREPMRPPLKIVLKVCICICICFFCFFCFWLLFFLMKYVLFFVFCKCDVTAPHALWSLSPPPLEGGGKKTKNSGVIDFNKFLKRIFFSFPKRKKKKKKKRCDFLRRPPRSLVWGGQSGEKGLDISSNDPSAGSPTETLLRLLHPLQNKVQASSGMRPAQLPVPACAPSRDFTGSYIGWSDGRCVQRAGTTSTQYDELHLLRIPR